MAAPSANLAYFVTGRYRPIVLVLSSADKTRGGRRLGVKGRLFLATLAIAAFALLATVTAIVGFREVGESLDVVDARIAPSVASLEISRIAERLIATAPGLLAAGNDEQRNSVRLTLDTDIARLRSLLEDVQSDADPAVVRTLQAAVSSLVDRLAALGNLVDSRLEVTSLLTSQRSVLFDGNYEAQRLLAPWLEVTKQQIDALVSPGRPEDAGGSLELAPLIDLQDLLRTTQAQTSGVADLLLQASEVVDASRLAVFQFQLELAIADLETTTSRLDPRLGDLFSTHVAGLRLLIEGPNAIPELRRQELALISQGEEVLAEATAISGQLTDAVDQLADAAKGDIENAAARALSAQSTSTTILIGVGALSLLASVLIAWVFIGKQIVSRLTSLSESVLAIVAGRLQTPVAADGGDEIARMGSAIDVLRRNTLERDQLLAEKARTAERLEDEVSERTAALARSVRELRALGEVSRAVNSTVDLEEVLATIVAKATLLSETESGAIYVLDDEGETLELRATCGLDQPVLDQIDQSESRSPDTPLNAVVEQGSPIQIPDILEDSASFKLSSPRPADYRAALYLPLIGPDRTVGVLVVRRRTPGSFDESTIETLETFAHQSVLAIKNASLFAEVQDKGAQLEIANEQKGHFIASASHDLRQPLHALNFFASQLLTETDPVERNRLVRRINDAVKSMNELLEAVLDISKLDAGLLEVNLRQFSVQSILDRMETTFAESARHKGLRLSVVPSSAWVRSDPMLVERIVMNLVANAVRYTNGGGVVVGCRPRGSHIRIDVCDSGSGLPDEHRRRLFDGSAQPATLSSGGLGLGLSIVSRLARLLGHPIEVDTRSGRGSRLSLLLPATEQGSVSPEGPAKGALIPDPASGRLIVLIDDDPLALDGMEGVLRGWGCQVVAVRSGESALAALEREHRKPDLLISDFWLSKGETGIDAINRIREAFGMPIPACLISGDIVSEPLREASAKGYPLLHKPVTPLRLRAVIHQLIDQERHPDTDHPTRSFSVMTSSRLH